MLIDEIIIKILTKTDIEMPGTDLNKLRVILEENLCDYDIQPMTKALTTISNLKERIFIYLASRKIEGLSKQTLHNYQLQLLRFADFIDKSVEDITTMDIRCFLAHISKGDRIKKTTLSTIISNLKTFFTWIENEGYIAKSPMKKIKATKAPKRLRSALKIEEIERLREGCKTIRQKALFELLYSTGCRLSEIVDIDIDDINWSNLSFNVVGKGDKERKVFFSAKAKLYLQGYLFDRQEKTGPLFLTSKYPFNRLGGRSIEKEVKKIALNAGFDKSIFPHLLRHSFATNELKAGTSLTTIQKLLGHTNVAITQIYAETDDSAVEYEYKKHAM